MAGFSYRGINITQFGAHWVPSNNFWHLWENDYRTIERVVDSQDGGHWYGNVVSPKSMDLTCYFEEISEYKLASIVGLFARDTHGDLIFDERPWLTYSVRPTKKIEITKYNAGRGLVSGTMTIFVTAYYPFATTELTTLESASAYPLFQNKILETTGLVEEAKMPSLPALPITEGLSFKVYNAGTARADTIIRVAGDVGGGIIIYNKQTNQYAKVIGITSDITTSANRWLEMNSRTGECHITDGSNKSNGFRYHDKGYIQLAPGTPIIRGLNIEYDGSSVTANDDLFSVDSAGRSIWVNGWADITSVLGTRNVVISRSDTGQGAMSTDVVLFNEIVVTPITAMNLTKFDIDFKHTFG